VACSGVNLTFTFNFLPVKCSSYMVITEDKMNLTKLIIARFWKNAFSAGTSRVVLVLSFSMERYTFVNLCG
jgi:hypothetical protein